MKRLKKGQDSEGDKVINDAINELRTLFESYSKELDSCISELKTFILSMELCNVNRIKEIEKIEKSLLKRYNLKASQINHLVDFYNKNKKIYKS